MSHNDAMGYAITQPGWFLPFSCILCCDVMFDGLHTLLNWAVFFCGYDVFCDLMFFWGDDVEGCDVMLWCFWGDEVMILDSGVVICEFFLGL